MDISEARNNQHLQEQLTRSILPQHIVAKIKKDFRDIFKFIEEHKKSPPPKGRPYRYDISKHDVIRLRSIINYSIISFQRFMRGDARQCEHPVRGRGELLWADRNAADTETRGDVERSVWQFR